MDINVSSPSRAFAFVFAFFVVDLFVVSFYVANDCEGQVTSAFGSNLALSSNSRVESSDTEFYEPIEKKIEGWTIVCDPKLLVEESKKEYEPAFKALANHLQRITYLLPKDRLNRIQQCRIWIEVDNPLLKGMQYHPGRGWLLSKKLDPRLVKHVHIPKAKALTDRSNWAKHPYVILHELAHAYHDQVYGFDDKSIKKVFDAAKESKTYEEVIDHRGRKVRHYGLNNQMEYFAESTEAYLGVNDFFPFVRAELKQHDPKMFDLMKQVWGKVD